MATPGTSARMIIKIDLIILNLSLLKSKSNELIFRYYDKLHDAVMDSCFQNYRNYLTKISRLVRLVSMNFSKIRYCYYENTIIE